MTEKPKCPTHGTELPPSGQCPKCLLDLGLAAGAAASSSGDPATPRGPRYFAGYKLVRQIGCGGMGVVYEAIEVDLNRTVALKLILDAQACSPVARRRFLIEAEAAARLDHPNIVPVYHVGEHEDQPFMSMKLVKGESLRAKMSRGEVRLPTGGDGATKSALIAGQKAIARLIADVARAVHHAHAQNVVHRDLKPGNILIDAEGSPQLTDFGLAKILDEHHLTMTEPGMIQGTVPYMSPQQVRGEKVSAAADTYSLGVILYELLTGQLPYRGTTPLETMRLIEEQPSTRPGSLNKHIHRDLETICLKCLEKNPGNRYASTADLAEDLDRWLRNEPVKARPAGVFLRTFRWAKRNPVAMALISSLSLALVATAGMFWQWKKASHLQHTILRSQWSEAETKLWLDANLTSMTIKAEELANLKRWRPPVTKGTRRLTFALAIGQHPVSEAEAFAPFLRELQNRMRRANGTKVVFDLKVVKSYTRFNEVASGAVDFMHLGGIPYWRAKEQSNGVEALVQDRIGRESVIAVRENSPITNLRQFEGRSFAFPDTNATLGLWAKVELVKAGIRGTNLSHIETIGDLVPIESGDPVKKRLLPGDASGVAAAYQVRKGSLFESADFLDPTTLVHKLRAHEDGVSQCLWSQLSSQVQQQVLTNSNPADPRLLDALAEDLNHLLTNVLYDPRLFTGIGLSSETLALQPRNPQGEDLIRLNRLLLQDVYPRELAKRRQCDGAALQKRRFDRVFMKRGLRVIREFNSTPSVYAAREGLDLAIKAAFQRAMLEMNSQPKLLSTIPIQRAIGGFQMPNLADLERLHEAMTNEASQFEDTAPAPGPAARESAGVNPSPR